MFSSKLLPGLCVVAAGLGTEWYFLGSDMVVLTIMAYFALMALLSVAVYAWEPAIRPGSIVEFPEGPYAVMRISRLRRQICVLPVRLTGGMSYEATGEAIWLSKSELWAKTTKIYFSFCSVTLTT